MPWPGLGLQQEQDWDLLLYLQAAVACSCHHHGVLLLTQAPGTLEIFCWGTVVGLLEFYLEIGLSVSPHVGDGERPAPFFWLSL